MHASGEDEELTDEAVKHGQACGGETCDDEHGDDPRKLCGEATVVANVIGTVALVQQPEEHEEGGAADALVEGLVDASIDTGDGEGEHTKDDHADVTEGCESGKALEVLLYEGE